MKTKIIAFLMLAVLFISSFYGCFDPTNIRGKEKHTHGDFVVIYRENNTCSIYDLSEEGREKEVLIIPEYIDEKKVTGFDTFVNSATDRCIYAPNLKKLYFLSAISSKEIFYGGNYKVFLFYGNNEVIEKFVGMNGVYFYIKSNCVSTQFNMLFANVSYYYNYENDSSDGYYWIDDCINETIEYRPEPPTRNGYEFAGWYKEPECINAWDFENDIVYGNAVLDENYNYVETKLYAKWVEI